MWDIVEILLALAAAVSIFVVGLIVWFGEKKNYLRIPFLRLTFAVGAWILTNVFFSVGSVDTRFTLALVSYGAAMMLATETFYFVLRLVRSRNHGLRVSALVLGYTAVLVSMIPGVVGIAVEDEAIITNPVGITIYGVVLALYLLAACVQLIISRQKAGRVLKRQIGLILFGVGASSVLGLTFNLILPMLGNYGFIQLGPASAVIFVAAIAYAIARYSLFDVRLAIVRGIAYLATFATLAAFYFVVATIVANTFNSHPATSDQTLLNIATALLMALLLQPIKRFFDKLTGRIFYRDTYDTDTFFAEVNQALSASTDLRSILDRVANVLSRNLRSEQVFFFAFTGEGHYILAGTDDHTRLAIKDARAIEEYIKASPEGRDTIKIDDFDVTHSLRRLMMTYRIEILVPILRAKEVLGFVCLGERRSGAYTRRDIRLLGTIVDELMIAIQKALAVEEVKELNAHLEQRVTTATKELRASNSQLQRLDEVKDEFISMASHQLRTPLTSIKGYISMLMEGDVGEVTKEQKHLLQEAYISSERMVRLIGDFLNVSRLQTGKFVVDKHPVALAQLVRDELDALQPSVAARGLKFIYKAPKNIPMLDLDENKIQQVVMNFSDNAIYYSKDGSVITVTLKKSGDSIEFKVKDNGIGVPADQQAQLFGKFFRATNARRQRPDGTGVGLFLAKKVIDAHGGEIIFSSKENKGSTFGFRLPIEQLRVRDTNELDN